MRKVSSFVVAVLRYCFLVIADPVYRHRAVRERRCRRNLAVVSSWEEEEQKGQASVLCWRCCRSDLALVEGQTMTGEEAMAEEEVMTEEETLLLLSK